MSKNPTVVIKISKQAAKQYQSTLSDIVEKLSDVLRSVKEQGAKYYAKAVDAYCSLHAIQYDNLDDKEILSMLKEVKKDLRPMLCKAADITEPSFNTYASQWADELGYPKQKQNKPTKAPKTPEEPKTPEGGNNPSSGVLVSVTECSIHVSGDVEKDCEELQLQLISLIQDTSYGRTMYETVKTVLRKIESGQVKVAVVKQVA